MGPVKSLLKHGNMIIFCEKVKPVLFFYLVFWTISHHMKLHVYLSSIRLVFTGNLGPGSFPATAALVLVWVCRKTWRCCHVYKTHRGEEMRVSVETQEQIISLQPTHSLIPPWLVISWGHVFACVCVWSFISNSCNHANIAWRSTFINCLRLYVACKVGTHTHSF